MSTDPAQIAIRWLNDERPFSVVIQEEPEFIDGLRLEAADRGSLGSIDVIPRHEGARNSFRELVSATVADLVRREDVSRRGVGAFAVLLSALGLKHGMSQTEIRTFIVSHSPPHPLTTVVSVMAAQRGSAFRFVLEGEDGQEVMPPDPLKANSRMIDRRTLVEMFIPMLENMTGRAFACTDTGAMIRWKPHGTD